MKIKFEQPNSDYKQERQTLVDINDLGKEEPVYKYELLYALNNYKPKKKRRSIKSRIWK